MSFCFCFVVVVVVIVVVVVFVVIMVVVVVIVVVVVVVVAVVHLFLNLYLFNRDPISNQHCTHFLIINDLSGMYQISHYCYRLKNPTISRAQQTVCLV